MKELNKKFLAGVLATLTLAASTVVSVAYAEVGASVGASNMYYWRGYDLGYGDPAIWGDINVSGSGAYAGMWASSGDSTAGTEYDLYFGYGHEFGDFGLDISYWTYSYPSATSTSYVYSPVDDSVTEVTEDASVDPGDLAEIVLGLSYGPVALTYYHGIEDLEDYWYATLEATVADFTFKYGKHETDYAHFDITYAYNDNLSFTLGTVVDDLDGTENDNPKFVVNLTLPIE